MKQILTVMLLLGLAMTVRAQQYGGDIKLKFTYKDRPLVGYTITASINGHDIGGKGVTDRNGEVRMHTDPLPIPNIDVKGVRDCGGSHYEFEASGFVYVSPTDGNFYHLKMDYVAKTMSEWTGMPVEALVASFGFNCQGALGGDDPNAGSTNSGNATTTNNTTTNDDQNTTNNNASDKKEENDFFSKKSDDKPDEQSETEIRQEQWKEDFESGKLSAEGYQNQRAMLENQIDKYNKKIMKAEHELEDDKLSSNDENELLYDITEWQIEKEIKQIKLEKCDKEIANGNTPLTGSARTEYKRRIEDKEEQLKQLKDDRKSGVSMVDDELVLYSEKQITDMGTFELKKAQFKLKTQLQKKKLALKTKGKLIKKDKKEALENEIKLLEETIALMDVEIEKRDAEKEQEEQEENQD